MKALPSLVLLCLALVAVPATLAQATSIPATSAVDVPQVPVQVPDVQVPQAPASLGVSTDVAADVQGLGASVQAHVAPQAQVGPDTQPLALDASSSSHATWQAAATQVATQAAGAGLLTILLVAVGSGLDGLRASLLRSGRVLLRLVPFVPLFSRIAGDDMLDNKVRARVHETIVNEPGLSVEDIRSRIGIAWGTAVHHLRRLEAAGLVVSTQQNARRRYFAANTAASSRRVHLAALAHPTARRVAEYVRQAPGTDQTALCVALGLRNPAASKQLQQLAAHGLVLVERDGRRCLYHPTAALQAAFGVYQEPTLPAYAAPRPTTTSAV